MTDRLFSHLIVVACCASLPSTGAAQNQIADGNVSYSWLPPSTPQLDSNEAFFTANAASDTNVLFEQWWAFRLAGDTSETYFSGANLAQSAAGSHADLDWSDLDSRGLLSAALDIDVTSTGAIGGRVRARLTLTNVSSQTVTVDLFHYLDLDICSANPNTVSGTGLDYIVTGNCDDLDAVSVVATGADRYCVAPFSTDECGIATPGATDLSNTQVPFGPPGDYSGAFQWQDRVLTPGNILIAVVTLEHNPPVCLAPANTSSFGSASAHSNLFLSSELPIVGSQFDLLWSGAPPGAAGTLLVGDTRTNFAISNLLIQVVPAFDIPVASDLSGQGFLPVPVTDPAFCGTNLEVQGLFLEPTAAPIPVCHTNGLTLIFGR